MTVTGSNGTETVVSYLKHRCKQWNQSIFFLSYVCDSVVVVIMNMCTITVHRVFQKNYSFNIAMLELIVIFAFSVLNLVLFPCGII